MSNLRVLKNPKRLLIRMEDAEKERLKLIAKSRDIPLSFLVREILEGYQPST